MHLEQSVHGEGLGHVGQDLVQAALLGAGELEGQRSLRRVQQRRVRAAAALCILLVTRRPAKRFQAVCKQQQGPAYMHTHHMASVGLSWRCLPGGAQGGAAICQ